MSLDVVDKIISTQFATWSATNFAKVFENVEFEPADSDIGYVKAFFLPGDSNQISMGATKNYRHVGNFIAQVFVRKGKGSRLAKKYAKEIGEIFRGNQFTDSGITITCRSPGYAAVGQSGEWYQVNVNVPIQWDELH